MEEVDAPLRLVQIDKLVILKIIKHCKVCASHVEKAVEPEQRRAGEPDVKVLVCVADGCLCFCCRSDH